MLVLAGDVRTSVPGMGALQDGGPEGLDIITMMKSITKFADTLEQPERAVALVSDAIEASMTHPRAPAFLRIPLDTTVEVVPSDPVRQATLVEAEPDYMACDEIAAALTTAERPAIFFGIGARTAELGPAVLLLAERLRCPVICDVEAKGTFPGGHSLSLGLFGVGGGR
ncbi:MAG: acetolactate synthase-1/2/3 large subunit [Myxococcota bacterium]|jgi:acetolactate synthase-1/2/3 large subunit